LFDAEVRGILPEMELAQAALPDLDTLDLEALKALILAQHAQLRAHEAEIEHLKLLLAKLQHRQFGRKSERLDQLELRLEDLEASQAEDLVAGPDPAAPSAAASGTPLSDSSLPHSAALLILPSIYYGALICSVPEVSRCRMKLGNI
jgi:Transposase C of IS166 homeodomain